MTIWQLLNESHKYIRERRVRTCPESHCHSHGCRQFCLRATCITACSLVLPVETRLLVQFVFGNRSVLCSGGVTQFVSHTNKPHSKLLQEQHCFWALLVRTRWDGHAWRDFHTLLVGMSMGKYFDLSLEQHSSLLRIPNVFHAPSEGFLWCCTPPL